MRAQRLARVPAPEFENRLAGWREVEGRREARIVASLFKSVARPPRPHAPPPLPEGRYRVIYADPPWPFETWSEAGQDRSPENHYPTMSVDAIAALPVDELVAEDCVLLLWAIGPMLPEALRVVAAWGFEYRTIGFVWAKRGAPGLGYWTRSGAEICLLGTRGRPRRLAADVPQLVHARRGRHSEKPGEVHALIERLVPGPYLELFARAHRAGWTAWGDEAEPAPPDPA